MTKDLQNILYNNVEGDLIDIAWPQTDTFLYKESMTCISILLFRGVDKTIKYEPSLEKINNLWFRPGLTLTCLYSL